MYLFISRRGDNAEIQIRFPASPDTVWHELTRLDECSNSDDPAVITGIDCEIHNLVKYIECANLGDDADIRKLNHLVTHLEGLSQQEKQVLSGALYMDHPSGLNDVLRIVNSVKNYELVSGAVSPELLGRWVVSQGLTGQEFAGSVRPYLNYETIGTEYVSQHDGVFTSNGYVKRKENVQVQAADDRPAFALTLASALGTYRLDLPASDNELAKAKLTVGNLSGAIISDVKIDYPWAYLLPLDSITLDDANALAQCARSMSGTELRTFGAAVEAEEPAAFSQAVCIAMDLDDYELIPEDMDEYGKQVLRRAGADDELLDTIDGYMDFAQLGRDSMEEDGVRRTEFGLVRRRSLPFDQQPEMGQTMC